MPAASVGMASTVLALRLAGTGFMPARAASGPGLLMQTSFGPAHLPWAPDTGAAQVQSALPPAQPWTSQVVSISHRPAEAAYQYR